MCDVEITAAVWADYRAVNIRGAGDVDLTVGQARELAQRLLDAAGEVGAATGHP